MGAFTPAENASSFSQRFLCLSRACLGELIVFEWKRLKNGAFRTPSSGDRQQGLDSISSWDRRDRPHDAVAERGSVLAVKGLRRGHEVAVRQRIWF